MKKTITAIAAAAAAAVTLTGCAQFEEPEPQKPIVEMVKLPDGTEVPCILLPNETETEYEEMSCDYPEDKAAK